MFSGIFWRSNPLIRSGNALSVFAISLFVWISLAAPYPAVAGPNASTVLSADMNPESGDQGQHARETKPGDDIKIEIYAKGVTESNGYTISVQYDESQVEFEGFSPGIPGLVPLTQLAPDLVTIGGAVFGGMFSGDQLFGTFSFRAKPDFQSAEFTITEVQVKPSAEDTFTPDIVLTAAGEVPKEPTGRDRVLGDLNPDPGFQGLTQREVGDLALIPVQVFGRRIVQATGFTIVVRYDTSAVTYQRFDVGPAIPGLPLPLAQGDSVKMVVASLGGTPRSGDGMLGRFLFRGRAGLTTAAFQIVSVTFKGPAGDELLEPAITLSVQRISADAPVIVRGPGFFGITDESVNVGFETNRPGDTEVEYALDKEFTSPVAVPKDTAKVRKHSQKITGLSLGTRYYVRVYSSDLGGNRSRAKGGSFTTLLRARTFPPVHVEGPAPLEIRDTEVLIFWRSDEASVGVVNYGIDSTLTETSDSTDLVRDHRVRLKGLATGTRHFFRVASIGAGGLKRESRIRAFRTATVVPPIRLLGRPIVRARSVDRIDVGWKTNVTGTSIVRFGETALEDSVVSEDLVRDHRISVVGLPPGTVFHLQVASEDPAGIRISSETFEGGTRVSRDDLLPKITIPSVVLNRTDMQAQVVWGTNESSDSQVEYGNSEDPDSLINLITDDELVVRHNMTLVGLVPGSIVYYRVGSTDGEGNGPTVGDILSFRLRAKPDSSNPIVIGGPVVQSGLVRWFTDEPADRTVVYGTASDPDSLNQELTFADFDRTHRVPILGLAPGTYFFRAGNTDVSGNQSLTDVFSFSISADRDTIPPGMRAVTVLNVTSTTATVGWRTTEPADSRISWGLTTDYTEDIQREDPVRVHIERITDLLPDTLYHFKVGSGDFEGNVSTTDPVGTDQISRDYTFKTLKADSDLELEFIKGPLVEFKNIVAIATWTTNRLANSKVIYGTPETFNTADEEVVERPEFVRDHVVRITNLVPGTEYFFQASSSDGVKTAVSVDPTLRTKPGEGLGLQPPGGDGSFVTSTTADVTFPVILDGPTVIASTASSITVEWETDERSDSEVASGLDNLDAMTVDENDVTKHCVVLSNLSPGESYQFQVGSTDVVGNGSTKSRTGLAKTATDIDLTAPVVTESPSLSYRSDRTVTIAWKTDEASNSTVEYGTSASDLDLTFTDPDPATEHSVVLTNLTAGTTYFYRVSSTDPSNNGPTREDGEFDTDSSPDLTAPGITETKFIFATDSTATITWTTDETANSAVQYGTDQTLALTAGSSDNVLSHRVTLTELTPGESYFFKVESIDLNDNKAGPEPAGALTFTTLSEPDQTAPAPPTSVSAQTSGGKAVVIWTGSEDVDVIGYDVSRSEDGGSFEAVATQVSGLLFTDTGLLSDVAYRYRINAVDASDNLSLPSQDALAAAATSEITAPGFYVKQGNPFTPTMAVTNATATEGTLTYTFQVSTQLDFSDIAASVSGLAEAAGIGPNDPGGLTAWTVDRALTENTTYYWRARANDGTFDGPFSATKTFTVNANQPERPGDADGNGVVNLEDFFVYALAFNTKIGDPGYDPRGDFDGDGKAGFEDLFVLQVVFDFQYIVGPGSSKPVVTTVQNESIRLDFETSLTSAGKGDVVVARLWIHNVTDLKGFGISLTYDGDVVEWLGIDAGKDVLKRDGGVAPLFWSVKEKGNRITFGNYQTEGSGASEGSVAEIRLRLKKDHPKGPVVSVTDLLVHELDRRTQVGVHLEDARLYLVPSDFILAHNYPNPFNPITTIRYAIPQAERVTLRIYNILGQQVATLLDARQEAGFYTVQWDGKDTRGRGVASGVYFYRMIAGKFVHAEKMLFLK